LTNNGNRDVKELSTHRKVLDLRKQITKSILTDGINVKIALSPSTTPQTKLDRLVDSSKSRMEPISGSIGIMIFLPTIRINKGSRAFYNSRIISNLQREKTDFLSDYRTASLLRGISAENGDSAVTIIIYDKLFCNGCSHWPNVFRTANEDAPCKLVNRI
jgi:hypothetical protein